MTTMTKVSGGKYGFLSHAFGADLSDGLSTEFYAEEWQSMLRAVADALGGCPRR